MKYSHFHLIHFALSVVAALTYGGFFPKHKVTNMSLFERNTIQKWSNIKVPAVEGQTYRPYGYVDASCVNAIVWPIPKNTSDFVHPELNPELPIGQWLNDRENLGIAMSGGGMRAATCTLGWLRGLHKLGILQKARYVSVNSGATWVMLPLAAKDLLSKKENNTDIILDDYLGKYLEPEEIKGELSELGSIGEVLYKSNVIKQPGTSKPNQFTPWIHSIEENFIKPKPFELGNQEDLYLDVGNSYLWNDKKILTNGSRLPFTIYASTAYPSGKNKRDKLFPYEFTLLYSGLPVDPNEIHTDLKSPLTSGFLQSIAFNTDVSNLVLTPPPFSESSSNQISTIFLPRPNKVFKIAEITGISSSFFGAAKASGISDKLNDKLEEMMKVHSFGLIDFLESFFNAAEYNVWTPSPGIGNDTGCAESSSKLNFVDGGIFDNTGILGLLRRNIRTIIACIASDSEVADTYEDTVKRFYDIAGLFGVANYESLKPEMKSIYNKSEVVFKNGKEEWESLMKILRDPKSPTVIKKELIVEPNPMSGVTMKGNVTIYFCLNRRHDAWTNKLNGKAENVKKVKNEMQNGGGIKPKDEFTQKVIMESVIQELFTHKASTVTSAFPYLSTFRIRYDKDLVNMLAHLSSYSIVEGLKNEIFDNLPSNPK